MPNSGVDCMPIDITSLVPKGGVQVISSFKEFSCSHEFRMYLAVKIESLRSCVYHVCRAPPRWRWWRPLGCSRWTSAERFLRNGRLAAPSPALCWGTPWCTWRQWDCYTQIKVSYLYPAPSGNPRVIALLSSGPLWNCLPPSVRSAETLSGFKKLPSLQRGCKLPFFMAYMYACRLLWIVL